MQIHPMNERWDNREERSLQAVEKGRRTATLMRTRAGLVSLMIYKALFGHFSGSRGSTSVEAFESAAMNNHLRQSLDRLVLIKSSG